MMRHYTLFETKLGWIITERYKDVYFCSNCAFLTLEALFCAIQEHGFWISMSSEDYDELKARSLKALNVSFTGDEINDIINSKPELFV